MMAPRFVSGWRPSPPDIRDAAFKFRPRSHVVAALPESVDLSKGVAGPFSKPWNQGELGSCGPQSLSADIVFAGLVQDGLKSFPMPSRLFSYYVTRSIMGTVNEDSGVNNRDMLKAAARFGWCDEALWPYDIPKFRTKPPQVAFDQANTRKIAGYSAVDQDEQTMKACLAGGDPFILGFSVYQSMMTAAVEKTGIIPMPRGMFDRQIGGHDVLAVGFDDRTGLYKILNSWNQWGDGGYGYLPYGFAHNPRLASDFWTVTKSGISAPAPSPATETHKVTMEGDRVMTVNGKKTKGRNLVIEGRLWIDGKAV